MEALLTDGRAAAAEKNLQALKTIMQGLPSDTRLAFIGDGPEAANLKQHFADMPNVKFMVSPDCPGKHSASGQLLGTADSHTKQHAVASWALKQPLRSVCLIS